VAPYSLNQVISTNKNLWKEAAKMFETLGMYEKHKEYHRNLLKEAEIDRGHRQGKEEQGTQSGLVRGALNGVGRMLIGVSQRLTKGRVSPQSGQL
jgi:hypothetical protein